ncbi:MAG: 4-hydroxy-tetrahydrodipicolinate reductase [Rhodospirillales bacterium]|jgi:4-hydroxy-tetrahydrodipicolinate reductase|nr:4-hydroxy-tetrahydrodipicolinate reductase [Rhodospirillales bacterium]
MKIGVTGSGGRMGRLLIAEVLASPDCELAGGCDLAASPAMGKDVAVQAGLEAAGLTVGDDAEALFQAADAVIDCTNPLAVLGHLELASRHRTILVLGTTGLESEHHAAVNAAALETVVVQASNMSVGVTLLMTLTERAAAALGPGYDVEITDIHHRGKVDSPSGTAVMLGQSVARKRGQDFGQVARKVRHGETGPRRASDIGFAVSRGGDVTGDHTVILAGRGERIELTQRNFSRALYAEGGVRAALWARDKPAGRYSMRNVLGFA